MTKKKIIVLAILFVAGIGYFYLNGGKVGRFQPLPTKEQPTSTGLYSSVPPFDQWLWKEGKDKEGDVVYRIKLPQKKPYVKYVLGLKNDVFKNFIDIEYINRDSVIKRNKEAISNFEEVTGTPKEIPNESIDDEGNIMKFVNKYDLFFARKWFIDIGDVNLDNYRTFSGKYVFPSISEQWYYALTRDGVVWISINNDSGCESISDTVRTNHPEYYSECLEYHSIYLPIVEKALSTLEIPDYVDDRGFASSTEIKLLPDSLRLYEVR